MTEKRIPLYGYQGAVIFDIYDVNTLADAVVRLMGPQRNVHLAVYNRNDPHDSAASSNDSTKSDYTGPSDLLYDIATLNYGFAYLEALFAPDGAEDRWAVFVFSGSTAEAPPAATVACCWEPVPTATGMAAVHADSPGAAIVVRCQSLLGPGQGDSLFAATPDPRFGVNVAYLRVPPHAARMQPHEYQDWLLVVARILTPGAGLAALTRDRDGVVPRCHLALLSAVANTHEQPLHLPENRDEAVAFSFPTPGGLTFAKRSWADIVAAVASAAAKDIDNYYNHNDDSDDIEDEILPAAGFCVWPLTPSEIAVHMPGDSTHRSTVEDEEAITGTELDGAPAVSISLDDFRARLAARIEARVAALLPPDAQEQLCAVDIWPGGCSWDAFEWPVSCRWPLTDASVEGAASVVASSAEPQSASASNSPTAASAASAASAGSFQTGSSFTSSTSSAPDYTVVPMSAAFGGSGCWPHRYDGVVELPVLASVRPIYRAYQVHVPIGATGDWTTIDVALDGRLDVFRYQLSKAVALNGGSAAFDVDIDALLLWQDCCPDGDQPHQFPTFRLTPQSTDDDWTMICSQRMTPDLWVTIDPGVEISDYVDYRVARWGFRSEYNNLETILYHVEAYELAKAASPSVAETDEDDDHNDHHDDDNVTNVANADSSEWLDDDHGSGTARLLDGSQGRDDIEQEIEQEVEDGGSVPGGSSEGEGSSAEEDESVDWRHPAANWDDGTGANASSAVPGVLNWAISPFAHPNMAATMVTGPPPGHTAHALPASDAMRVQRAVTDMLQLAMGHMMPSGGTLPFPAPGAALQGSVFLNGQPIRPGGNRVVQTGTTTTTNRPGRNTIVRNGCLVARNASGAIVGNGTFTTTTTTATTASKTQRMTGAHAKCLFCNVRFAPNLPAADRTLHVATVHADELRRRERAALPSQRLAEEPLLSDIAEVWEPPTQPEYSPSIATTATTKKRRRAGTTTGRGDNDSLYQPSQQSSTSEDDLESDANAESPERGRSRTKKRRRVRFEKDPTFWPAKEEKEEEEDNVSVEGATGKTKTAPSAAAPPSAASPPSTTSAGKRLRSGKPATGKQDPAWRPGKDDDASDDDSSNRGRRVAKRRRKVAGEKDPTYRPTKDDVDGEDEDEVAAAEVAQEVVKELAVDVTVPEVEPVAEPVEPKEEKAMSEEAAPGLVAVPSTKPAKKGRKGRLAPTPAQPVRRSPRLQKKMMA